VEQVLYRELMAAMGYSANQAACRRLADAVPYDELASEALTRPLGRRLDAVRALLLGHGGLLPVEAAAVPGGILREWAALDDGAARMPARSWQLRTGRPDNSPPRRLAGLATWLTPRLDCDWPAELAQWVKRAAAAPSPVMLTALFQVRVADEFWPHHFGFGRPTPCPRPWLIGRGRAMEIAVSVLLPAAFALGQSCGDDTLSGAALRCYQQFPATPRNRVVRHMVTQVAGGSARQVHLNACRQQGLLHLFRNWSAERHCTTCPAGGAKG
jgi:hypothetical protein